LASPSRGQDITHFNRQPSAIGGIEAVGSAPSPVFCGPDAAGVSIAEPEKFLAGDFPV